MNWASMFAKRRIQIVALAFLIALGLLFMKDLNPTTFDANLGIEFVGGVRIPISLERNVDSETMGVMVEAIKSRVNKFGLSQAVVRPLGDREIIVEIPRAESSVINSVERLLREQGRFEAIVDGKLALDGDDVIPNAVGGSGGEIVESTPAGASWTLVFAITGEGELQFASAASGKTGSAVMMFLDRPENAVLIVNQSALSNVPEDSVLQVLHKDGDDITLAYAEGFNESVLSGKSSVVIGKTLFEQNAVLRGALEREGFTVEGVNGTKRVLLRSDEEMTPVVLPGQFGPSISSWKAIGLRSAPTLQVEPLNQNAITQYSITGASPGSTAQEAESNARNELKELKSILSGGRLPVSTVIGSYYDVAPSLGRQFLLYSIIGLFLAVFVVAGILTIRYRRIELIIPVIVTTIVELVLLLAFLGTFGTLDLSAMAGVIALIGTGVDSQIIITDEFLRGRKAEEIASAKEKISRAFFIVFTTAGVSISSMLPLFLSGIVEVMGFALATIMGVIIGLAVTRPAYGVLIEEAFGMKKHDENNKQA